MVEKKGKYRRKNIAKEPETGHAPLKCQGKQCVYMRSTAQHKHTFVNHFVIKFA